MTIQLYANNAKTTLAAPVNSSQTTITVAPGTGAKFPSPSTGQAFKVTLVSASTPTVNEFCLCTSRTGDVLTVVRAQEGTSGTSFLLNDIAGNFDTSGVMTSLVQSQQLQANYYGFAVASGTGNALTATLPSSLTAISDGFTIIVRSSAANTGATTLVLTLGSTVLSSASIVKGNNTALSGGEIPAAGYPLSLTYSSTFGAWVLTDPTVILSAYALINSQTFTGTPRVPTATFNDSSTIIANTLWVQNQLANYAPIFSPTLTGVPKAPTAAPGTNTVQIATTEYALGAGVGGSGQTWQNLTGSRAFNTYYYNTTNKPILVCIVGDGYVGVDNTAYIYVNGVVIIVTGIGGGTNSTFTFIVPAGGNYIWIDQNGYVALASWSELRY